MNRILANILTLIFRMMTTDEIDALASEAVQEISERGVPLPTAHASIVEFVIRATIRAALGSDVEDDEVKQGPGRWL